MRVLCSKHGTKPQDEKSRLPFPIAEWDVPSTSLMARMVFSVPAVPQKSTRDSTLFQSNFFFVAFGTFFGTQSEFIFGEY
jgi:hypothetical protein